MNIVINIDDKDPNIQRILPILKKEQEHDEILTKEMFLKGVEYLITKAILEERYLIINE